MASTTNILVIAPYRFYPPKTGGERCIALQYIYLSRELPLSLISTANNQFGSDAPFTFLPLLGNSRMRYINPLLFFKLKKLAREKKITHLIIEHPYYGWLAILLKWFCKIKIIVRSHNIEGKRFQTMGKWWWPVLFQYERIVHRHADINFFITDEEKEFAIKRFKLDAGKCLTIPYGFELTQPPSKEDCLAAKKYIKETHNITASEKILLFNGALDYKPNIEALDAILDEINPRLLKKNGFSYKIIICGGNLPERFHSFREFTSRNIIYPGYVNDISIYFKGADCFINPVLGGGGIKTKLVEALGYNLSCVSTQNGAIGISTGVTGNKLQIITNNDWENFTNAIFDIDTNENIPPSFFDHFYWGNIAGKAAKAINNDK